MNHSTMRSRSPPPVGPAPIWQPAGRERRGSAEPEPAPPSDAGFPPVERAASGAPPSMDSWMAFASSGARQRPPTQIRPLSQGASLSMTPSQSSSIRLHFSGRGSPGVHEVAMQVSATLRQ